MTEDDITDLIGDLWSDDVAREMLERFAAKVRREALAVLALPIAVLAFGPHHSCLRLTFKDDVDRAVFCDVIRALIEREVGGGE